MMEHSRNQNALAFIVFSVFIVLSLGFWRWTDWSIEDGLIVARIARNFSSYGVLSYNPGQWISSSTSFLFALFVGSLARLGIPALIASKATGIVAAAATGGLLYRDARAQTTQNWRFLAPAFYLFLPTTVAYSICGLETPVYAFFCAASLFSFSEKRYSAAFILAALAATIRPDGILVLGIVAAFTFCTPNVSLRQKWMGCCIAGLILVAYFGIHYWIYKTWFPQTVAAKAGGYHVHAIQNSHRYLHQMFLAQPWGLPFYGLAFAGVFQAIQRRSAILILAVWYAIYHLAFMLRAPLFDWYLQPPTFVIAYFASLAVMKLIKTIEFSPPSLLRSREVLMPWFVLGLAVMFGFSFNFFYGRGKLKNRVYEREVRESAGRWLKGHTRPRDLVFTESLGYIGYYTDNIFVDWPGLVAPGVSVLVRGVPRVQAYQKIIEFKKPSYLVLRDHEWKSLFDKLHSSYLLAADFPASDSHAGPGYVILQRNMARP